MASLYLLDTNIISSLMHEPLTAPKVRVRDLLKQATAPQLCTSIIVQCELLFAIQRKGNLRLRRRYEEAMDLLQVLPLDGTIAVTYAQLRTALEQAGTPLAPNDLLIAAHALALDATLVSTDTAFARVPGLKLENWLT